MSCNNKKSASREGTEKVVQAALPDFSSIQTADVFAYSCGDSLQFSAHVNRDSTWLFLPDTTVKVNHVRSGSGARYEEGSYLYWSKGNEAILQKPKGSFMTCTETPHQRTRQAAKIRGASFWAQGQEPGWHLTITNGRQMTYIGNYGEDTVTVPTPEPSIDTIGGIKRAMYKAAMPTDSLRIEINNTSCTDAMSGAEFPSSVTITVGANTYRGCGQFLED